MTISDESIKYALTCKERVGITVQRAMARDLLDTRSQLATVMKSEQEWMEKFNRLIETIKPTLEFIESVPGLESCKYDLLHDLINDANQIEPILCKWQSDEDGVYETDCGNSFVFDTDNATDNGVRFCFYCGRQIIDIPYVGEADEGDFQPQKEVK